MDNTQAYQVIDKIKKLWPTWKATEDENILYCQQLNCFDYDVAYEAVEEHKASKQGSNLSPKLYHIIDICKGKGQKDTKKKSKVVVCYYIECIENKDNPRLVGKKVPYYAESKETVYQGRRQEKSAEKAAERHNASGGTWIFRLINYNIEE